MPDAALPNTTYAKGSPFSKPAGPPQLEGRAAPWTSFRDPTNGGFVASREYLTV